MKQKVRFILKNPVAVSSTAINMIFSWGYKDEKGNYKPLKYSTGQSVNPKNWNIEEQRAEGSYSDGVNSELASIEADAYKLYVKLKDEGLTPGLLKSELDKNQPITRNIKNWADSAKYEHININKQRSKLKV